MSSRRSKGPKRTLIESHPESAAKRPRNTAGSSSNASSVPREKSTENVVWSGLKKSLNVLEKGSSLLPPFKSVLNEVIACLDAVHITEVNRSCYDEMATELKATSDNMSQYVSQLGPEDNNEAVSRIARLIELETKHINDQRQHGVLRQAIQDQDNMVKHWCQIEALFRQLLADMVLRLWQNTDEHLKMHLLERLSQVNDARYNSSYSTTVKRRACTAETRKHVQIDLQAWVNNPEGAKVYWMNGMAGTGKTTIAYSLCEWLEANQLLGASFFCSRTSTSCSNLNLIVPTIAYQLAQYLPAFRSTLCKLLKHQPDAGGLSVGLQFERLIQKPLLEITGAIPRSLVVTIDALDECQDTHGVRLMLEVLREHAGSLPLKFFVTSRPEPIIQVHMRSPDGYMPTILLLHEIEKSVVEQDIRLYLNEALNSLSPAPSEEQMAGLAQAAGNLFIYAATVVRYILPDKRSGNPMARLESILTETHLTGLEGPVGIFKHLDNLYSSILAAALEEDLNDGERQVVELVLKTVVCAKEPMNVASLALLLGIFEQDVLLALGPLQTVLHVSETEGLVSTLHASFPDYMLDQPRSQRFYIDQTQHNSYLARCCFKIMQKQLKFNIYNLESSFVCDKDVPHLKERGNQAISAALLYACRYWGDHLRVSDGSITLQKELDNFLLHRLLFWMELLNLKGFMNEGEHILTQAQVWLSTKGEVGQSPVHVADARNFVTMFAGSACSLNTCHLYLSALEFLPRASSVYKHYRGRVHGTLKVDGTLARGREQAALATWEVGASVHSVATSPDGTRIVSGSFDGIVRVWDAHTGHLVAEPLKGHSDWICGTAFSPDGGWIASSSCDKTIRMWNAYTGDLVSGPFEGHTDAVFTVAFSPDGARIASGSHDHTVRIWEAGTGSSVGNPFRGHTDAVYGVAFSSDGSRVVSGSYDETIRVWDVRNNNLIAGPFRGHEGPVWCVSFSPDDNLIVSGSSDETIGVWDACSGEPVMRSPKGSSDWIFSVSISPDGSRIAAGSRDQTVRVWDLRTGGVVAGPFKGHKGPVWSVAFSPDGTRMFSGSRDKTIRVWDPQSGNPALGWFQGHTDAICSVSFSPDGTRIVSGSRDRTACVWDAYSGDLVAGPFVGHADWDSPVTFLPDGKHIASSKNEVIRVWDVQTTELVPVPLHTHLHPVKQESLSCDDLRAVAISYDKRQFADVIQISDHRNIYDSPSTKNGPWTFNSDGWVTHNGKPLFWVPPDLVEYIPQPPVHVAIYPRGSIAIDSSNLLVGEQWIECYTPE